MRIRNILILLLLAAWCSPEPSKGGTECSPPRGGGDGLPDLRRASPANPSPPVRTVVADPLTIVGRRPMSAIGLKRTALDSVALRESVTASLADVLTLNSHIFIKSYGRATLSTASFRGTAPSHTLVSWNGMSLNSPMLGMVDFSTIPAYLVDEAAIYHGASSVGVAGGGLGGAITLATKPAEKEGFDAHYILGAGSYETWDQFLKLGYGRGGWQFSTRACYAVSENDFSYLNRDKWNFTYDAEGNIAGRARPVERNRNGDFRDLHILQEAYFTHGDSRWGVAAWWMDSRRGIPALNVNYRPDDRSSNTQSEQTLRAALTWRRLRETAVLTARAGYTHTGLRYLELSDNGGSLATRTDSRSRLHTLTGAVEGGRQSGAWIFSGSLSASQHFVRSADRAVIEGTAGYRQGRFEMSALVSVRWRPTARIGLALDIREELHAHAFSTPIPALLAEWFVTRDGALIVKASAVRNYRYPTLNDLWFVPGGNPLLKPEHGLTLDGGIEGSLKHEMFDLKGEATLYNSLIDDWILWLPTGNRGLWTPLNIRRVHSHGAELRATLALRPAAGWGVFMQGNYAVTRSINRGDPMGPNDRSVGRQLMYVPEHSGSVVGRLAWRDWEFAYKWNYYSERFGTSSNELGSRLWRVPPYYMSDISLQRRVSFRRAAVSLKITVDNLFDEAYESVLARPMAGRNYGIFIGITPR